MGMIGLPYFALFPWVDVVVSFLLLAAIARIIVTNDWLGALLFFLIMNFLHATLVTYALLLDKESKKLALLAGFDNLIYNHFIAFTTLRAGVNYTLKKKGNWGKLKRYGKNTVPVMSSQ